MVKLQLWVGISVAACLAVGCNGETPVPGTSCEVLSTCCARMTTGPNRTTCESTVSVGLNSTCLTALLSYEAAAVCEGEDGGSRAPSGDSGDDVQTVDPDPCGTLAGCCGASPVGSECWDALNSNNATLCAQELASGLCGDSGAH